jgi:polysaccharide biosynthesis/export protein
MEKYKVRANRQGWRRGWVRAAVVLPLLLVLAGCGGAKVKREATVGMTTFSFDQNQHPFEVFSDYRITPGDLLDVLFQIRTWIKKDSFKLAVDHSITVKFIHASELNVTQQVRPDGTITLPYIGAVYAIDKTVEEFTAELKEKYKDILNIPEISVEVPDFRSSIKELKADLHTAPRGLSRLVTVRPDGFVTFPMVGDVMAAGKTIPEVNETLNAQYEKILPGLHCDLFLEKHSGSVVYIVGQVKRQGGFEISRPISVLEALSLAEGYLPGAKLSSIFVIRRHQKKMVAVRVDLKKTLSFGSGSEMFFLKPNDIVYVPKTWLKKAAEVAKDLADMVFFRGWGLTGQIYIDEQGGLSLFGEQR